MSQQIETFVNESGQTVGAPFIDVDEWRDSPRPHRYVHGGFEGTHTLFSFYLPPAEAYRGRFFQYLEGGAGGHEVLLATGVYGGAEWIFDVAFEELGGYLVESNQGHYPNEGTGFANNWELYNASAHCARYGRLLAAEMYGQEPHHGYVWGGSGGGSRSIYCLENRPDVYQGASPHVIWSSPLGSVWSPAGYWWLVAHQKLPQLIDAMEPGGSGNPFEGLDVAEREAVAALYRFGYPRGAERQLWAFSPWTWGFVNTTKSDPGYYHDFWNTAGYLGHDSPERFARYQLDLKAKVTRVVRATQFQGGLVARLATAGATSDLDYGITLDAPISDWDSLFGARLTFTSGQARGRTMILSYVEGDIVATSGEHCPELFADVAVGDEVTIENREFIAWCHLFLHSLQLDMMVQPDPVTGAPGMLEGFAGLQAWALDGKPMFPQRSVPMVQQVGGGTGHSGRFTGKMIHVNATHDAQVWPNGVAAYKARIRRDKGDDLDGSYRLWWVENAPHGAPQLLGPALTTIRDPGLWQSWMVDYDGVTAQALRDLVRWVEEDVAPPPSTAYTMSGDGDIKLGQDASTRGGVQPVARATANGGARADVRVGETVRFAGAAEQPAGVGAVVAAEWDFEGTGDFVKHDVPGDTASITVEAAYAYSRPGTYFASFRVGGHRDGAAGRPPFARNNARVRVVVHP